MDLSALPCFVSPSTLPAMPYSSQLHAGIYISQTAELFHFSQPGSVTSLFLWLRICTAQDLLSVNKACWDVLKRYTSIHVNMWLENNPSSVLATKHNKLFCCDKGPRSQRKKRFQSAEGKIMCVVLFYCARWV